MFQAKQKIGQYTLVRKLAKGGFGEVWLAEKQSPLVTKRVAVKLPHNDQVDFQAIRQEATLWEEASGHPNVLPLIDADVYDGQVVIVSEYVEDGSLADKLKRERRLPIEQAVKITLGILKGLEYLHSKKIIHRDIKPANVLMQVDTPRLADFGISRAMHTKTVSSTIVGTENFMSPEAFEGERNEKTDIWSVGVLLYKLLKGDLPFPQIHPTEAMYAILTKEPEPLPDEIPPRLQEIVYKALAKELTESSSRRYQTAAEMREDLERFLESLSQPALTPNQTVAALPKENEIVTRVRIPVANTGRLEKFRQNLVRRKTSPVSVFLIALGICAATVFLFSLLTQSSSVNPPSAETAAIAEQSATNANAEITSDEAIKESKKLYGEGDKFYAQKKYAQAIEAYSKAIELNSNDFALYNNRGIAFHALGEFEKAIADYTRAIELNPYHFSGYNNRGAAYEDIGSTEQAIADYRKALELEPNNKTARDNLEKILK